MSSPFTSAGEQIAAAANLYVAQKGNTIAGRQLELLIKDATCVVDVGRRFAQEMIVNDKMSPGCICAAGGNDVTTMVGIASTLACRGPPIEVELLSEHPGPVQSVNAGDR